MIARITCRFGEKDYLHPAGHKGVDIGLKEGTPLRSIHDGIVKKVYDGSTTLGEGVKIQFTDGKEAIYGHMSDAKVKVGQMVQDGQIIGLSGNTGRSTGPHLHFQMYENGQLIDPTPVINETINHDGVLTSIGRWFMERGTPGTFEHADYNVWSNLGESMMKGIVDTWLPNYMMALPFLFVVSMGMWGFLSMISKRLATFGVGFVMIMGGIVII